MATDDLGDARERLKAAQRRVAAARTEGEDRLEEALVELHGVYAALRSHDEALAISGELVELRRRGGPEVAVAEALTLHAIDWRRAIGYPQAIDAASEASALYDALARPLERAVGESHARALECLAGSLGILRRDEESLAARAQLAAVLQSIGAERERLADVFGELATGQRRHGTLAGELQARREAIAALQPLFQEDPDRHGPPLLEALGARARALEHVGSSESERAQREYLATLEQLALRDLERYGDRLLATYDAALPPFFIDPITQHTTLTARVLLTRSLMERWPALYTHRHIHALLGLSAAMHPTTHAQEALAPTLEAMRLLEEHAANEYDAMDPWLIDALDECERMLWRLERWDESESIRRLAISVLRGWGKREHRMRVVELLFNHVDELLLLERHEAAVAVGREAMAELRACCDARTAELRDLTEGLVRLGELERFVGQHAAASSSLREVVTLVHAFVEGPEDESPITPNELATLVETLAAAHKELASVLLEEGARAEAIAELRESVGILHELMELHGSEHIASYSAAVHALVEACRGAETPMDDAAELLALTRRALDQLHLERCRKPETATLEYVEALADLLALAVEPTDRAEAVINAAKFAADSLANFPPVRSSLYLHALALDRVEGELRAIGENDLACTYADASKRCWRRRAP